MRLLVVESSHTMRKIIGFSLEKLPVQIVFAKDGDEAISLANQGIHLLLCSSRLGAEDGYGTAGLLKSKFPFIKTLMLLQKNEAYDAGRGLVFGITAVLEKPFFTQTLVEKVCELLSITAPDQEEYAVFNRVIPLKQPGAKTKTPHQATASEIFSLTATPTPIPSSMAQSASSIAPAFQAKPPKAEPVTTKTMVGFADANVFQQEQAAQEPILPPIPQIPSFQHLPPKREVPKPQDQKTLIGFSSSDDFKAILESERQEQQKQSMSPSMVGQVIEQSLAPPIEYSLPPPPPPPVELEEDLPPLPPQSLPETNPSYDMSASSERQAESSHYPSMSYESVSFEAQQSEHTPEDAYQSQAFSEPSTVFGYGYMPSIEDQKPTSEMPIINRDLLPTVAPHKYAPEAEETPILQAQQTPELEAELSPPTPYPQLKDQGLKFSNISSLQDKQAEGKRITEAFQQVEKDLPYEGDDEGRYDESNEQGTESQSEALEDFAYQYQHAQGADEGDELNQGQQEELPPTQAQAAVNATVYGNAFLNKTHAKLSKETYQWLAQKLDLPEHHEDIQAMLDKMLWEILPALAEATIKQELSKLLSPKS